MATLYELSCQSQYTLTDLGEEKIIVLRQKIDQKKKQVNEFELLFDYVKKTMDANAGNYQFCITFHWRIYF